jgi:hypothetical protein
VQFGVPVGYTNSKNIENKMGQFVRALFGNVVFVRDNNIPFFRDDASNCANVCFAWFAFL